MSLDIPTAGSPILDTWGAAVAGLLNQLQPYVLESDVATDASTAANGAVMITVPVVAGRAYNFRLAGTYEVSATNQGIQLLADYSTSGAAGSLRGYQVVTGNGSATGKSEARVTSSFDGRTSTDVANIFRSWWMDFGFVCTTSGSMEVRVARGGTSGSTGVTVHRGSGGLVIETPA